MPTTTVRARTANTPGLLVFTDEEGREVFMSRSVGLSGPVWLVSRFDRKDTPADGAPRFSVPIDGATTELLHQLAERVLLEDPEELPHDLSHVVALTYLDEQA